MSVAGNLSEMMKMNKSISSFWLEMWFVSHVPKLMHQQTWFHSNCDTKVGDIAQFIKHDSTIAKDYQYSYPYQVEIVLLEKSLKRIYRFISNKLIKFNWKN